MCSGQKGRRGKHNPLFPVFHCYSCRFHSLLSSFHFFHLIPLNSFLSLSRAFLSLSPPPSAGICTQRNKGRLVSFGVRSERDFQIKPCHFASHWALAPPWQVLTVVLPWQLPIWGLGGRGGGREGGEGIGREIKSSVEASEMQGLYNSSQALYLWAPPSPRSIPLSPPSSLCLYPSRTNCLVHWPVKWGERWMLWRSEGGKERKKKTGMQTENPLGMKSTSGSLSKTTVCGGLWSAFPRAI